MSPPFEIIDPSFKRLVLPNAPLKHLGGGFGWLEGPVWFADMQCLLVSDIPNNRVMRWVEGREGDTLSIFREPSGFENGHTRDREGRLISCSHHDRCIARTEWDGTITVLADRFQGRRLNSPNDVVVKRDGTIWFSDPPYGINTDYEGGKQQSELPAALYRLDPTSRELTVASDAFQGPNGLCFSPDEARIYVVETGLQFAPDPIQHISVFDVIDGYRLVNGRVFATISPGNADGIRCDQDGNLWSGAGDGLHCLAPDGRLLGRIFVPSPVQNFCFGGRNRSELFLCAAHDLYTISTNTRGVQIP